MSQEDVVPSRPSYAEALPAPVVPHGREGEENLPDLEQPLLERHDTNQSGLFSTATLSTARSLALLEDDATQLKFPLHVALTFKLWLVVVGLAIAAPSLGDVLNLVGCASGTMIAFIVPSLLSFRLKRCFTYQAAILLLVGSVVGVVGTFFSIRKLARDLGLL